MQKRQLAGITDPGFIEAVSDADEDRELTVLDTTHIQR